MSLFREATCYSRHRRSGSDRCTLNLVVGSNARGQQWRCRQGSIMRFHLWHAYLGDERSAILFRHVQRGLPAHSSRLCSMGTECVGTSHETEERNQRNLHCRITVQSISPSNGEPRGWRRCCRMSHSKLQWCSSLQGPDIYHKSCVSR